MLRPTGLSIATRGRLPSQGLAGASAGALTGLPRSVFAWFGDRRARLWTSRRDVV